MSSRVTPTHSYIAQLDQGWSPKCEPNARASPDQWAVLKTTAVQPVDYDESENKQLPPHLRPRPAIEVEKGDVLVTRAGPRSRVGITCVVRSTQPRLMLADKIYRLKVQRDIADPVWLAQMLNAPQSLQRLEEMKTGISDSGLNLTQEKFLSLPLPLVSLSEQRRIVAKLDSLRARSARARHELDLVPKLIERYKQAILAKAFSGELTADWREQNGTNEAWPVVSVSEIAKVVTGSTPPTADKAKYFGGSLPFFKPTDLDAGYQVRVPRETLTEEGANRSRRVPAGATLVTCIGATISKTGFARVDCCTNQQINALVPHLINVHPEWLYWMVISPDFRDSIMANASATTLPIINKGRFEQLELPLPEKGEQTEIVSRIEKAFAWLDKIATEHARAEHLLPKLNQAILAKAFRGELVPQDPNDEPASVLLERIKAEREGVSAPKRRKATSRRSGGSTG